MMCWRSGPPVVLLYGLSMRSKRGGVFPTVDANVDNIGTLEEAGDMSAWNEHVGNYTSVDAISGDVQAELKKELDKGFMKFSTSREALEKEVGKLILSRVAAVVTTKNGKRKGSPHPRPAPEPGQPDVLGT